MARENYFGDDVLSRRAGGGEKKVEPNDGPKVVIDAGADSVNRILANQDNPAPSISDGDWLD